MALPLVERNEILAGRKKVADAELGKLEKKGGYRKSVSRLFWASGLDLSALEMDSDGPVNLISVLTSVSQPKLRMYFFKMHGDSTVIQIYNDHDSEWKWYLTTGVNEALEAVLVDRNVFPEGTLKIGIDLSKPIHDLEIDGKRMSWLVRTPQRHTYGWIHAKGWQEEFIDQMEIDFPDLK